MVTAKIANIFGWVGNVTSIAMYISAVVLIYRFVTTSVTPTPPQSLLLSEENDEKSNDEKNINTANLIAKTSTKTTAVVASTTTALPLFVNGVSVVPFLSTLTATTCWITYGITIQVLPVYFSSIFGFVISMIGIACFLFVFIKQSNAYHNSFIKIAKNSTTCNNNTNSNSISKISNSSSNDKPVSSTGAVKIDFDRISHHHFIPPTVLSDLRRSRRNVWIQILVTMLFVYFDVWIKYSYGVLAAPLLGTIASLMTITMFASPALTFPMVVRNRNAASVYTWANTLTTQLNAWIWTIYGALTGDIFIVACNFVGVFVSFIQGVLLLLYHSVPAVSEV